MRKILVTGFTAKMIGSKRLHRYYLTAGNMMIRALLEMKDTQVELRAVTWDEDLSQYDRIFIGLAPVGSLTSKYVDVCLGALARYEKKCILYVDDWSVCVFKSNAFSQLGRWDKYTSFYKFHPKLIAPAKETLVDILKGKYPIVCPLFTWGTHKAFRFPPMDERIIPIDVTNFAETIGPGEQKKKKRWVSASLLDHSNWYLKYNMKWPILNVQDIEESEVIKIYTQNWGILSARYANVGSGWWRIRYKWCGDVGGVMFCDPDDGIHIGPEFLITTKHIEGLTEEQLLVLASKQRDLLISRFESKEIVIKRLEGLC